MVASTHHSLLAEPRTESPLPATLESRFWPAAADAKLDGNWTGMVWLCNAVDQRKQPIDGSAESFWWC